MHQTLLGNCGTAPVWCTGFDVAAIGPTGTDTHAHRGRVGRGSRVANPGSLDEGDVVWGTREQVYVSLEINQLQYPSNLDHTHIH